MDICDREPAIDDVHRQDHGPPGDILVEVLRQADTLASGPIGRQAEEVDRTRNLDAAGEVCEEADASLQQAHEHEPVRVITSDGPAEAIYDRSEVVAGQHPRPGLAGLGHPPVRSRRDARVKQV